MIPSSESRFTRIKQCLEDKTTLAYLHFVAYVAASLTPFLKLFQRDEPLVHILYDKVNEVTRICFRMFLKTEVVAEKVGNELKAIDCEKSENWLPSKNMEIGSGTKRLVSGLPDDKQKTLRLEFRKSLKLMGKYMKEHLPLTNAVLRDLQCLHPLYRKEEGGRAAIGRLCNHLKKVTKTDEFSDAVCAEWLLYASDSALDNDTSKFDGDICGYWKHVSMMVDSDAQKKYVHLSFVGKAALTLSHGNAAPERGFSVNNALVTKERGSLSERSIVAVRVVKEAIRMYGSCTNVPITKEMLHAVKQAHSEYAAFLENERKEAILQEEERKQREQAKETARAAEKAKNDLLEQVKEQEQLEANQLLEQDTARELITEASKKLTDALQHKGQENMQSVKVAQLMLSAGNDKLSSAAKQLADIKLRKEKLQEKLRKQQETAKKAEGSTATVSAPPAKRRKLQ